MNRQIILASRSKARLQLLKEAGIPVRVVFADVDETRLRGEKVDLYALRVALAKTATVAKLHKDAVIIGVDTVIVLGDKILGKPADKKEAAQYLQMLSGRWHEVHSGTVVIDSLSGKILKKLVISRVKFSKLTKEQIDLYVATGEPMLASGAYSIQGKGRSLIEKVDGCLTNIIGVSIPVLMKMLKACKAV